MLGVLQAVKSLGVEAALGGSRLKVHRPRDEEILLWSSFLFALNSWLIGVISGQ